MTNTSITDQQLIDMLNNHAQRDQGFRLLMRQYGRCLYWHVRRIVIDHDDAEDVLQETAIKVLESVSKFKGDSQLGTWLYRIATNEALMHLRRQTRLFQSIDTLGPELAERLVSQPDLVGDEAAMLFQRAILQLPTQKS